MSCSHLILQRYGRAAVAGAHKNAPLPGGAAARRGRFVFRSCFYSWVVRLLVGSVAEVGGRLGRLLGLGAGGLLAVVGGARAV